MIKFCCVWLIHHCIFIYRKDKFKGRYLLARLLGWVPGGHSGIWTPGWRRQVVRHTENLAKGHQEKRPDFLSDGLILLHDNLRHHAAQPTRSVLQIFGWKTEAHPCRTGFGTQRFLSVSLLRGEILSTLLNLTWRHQTLYHHVAADTATCILHIHNGQTHHRLWQVTGMCWRTTVPVTPSSRAVTVFRSVFQTCHYFQRLSFWICVSWYLNLQDNYKERPLSLSLSPNAAPLSA